MSRSVISTFGSSFLALIVALSNIQAQQPPTRKQEEVIRVSTELVQTDVSVVDKDGRFVDGLRADQFELLIDGKPHPISFFEQIAAGSRRDTNLRSADAKDKEVNKEKPNTTVSAGSPARTIFFFVDDMHLSAGSMTRTRESLQRFVNNTMGTNDQVAITTPSGQLGFLQQLTDNKTILSLAIERLKFRSYDVSDMQQPPMTEYQAYAIEQGHTDVKEVFVEQTCKDVLKVRPQECSGAALTNNAVLDENNARSDRPGSTGGGTGTLTLGGAAGANTARWRAETLVKQRARVITRQAAQVTLGTLSSLESLVRRAAPLPERKLLVFLSEGFFINFVSSSQVYDLRRITDAASRSGTVIYTIDARGLTSGTQDASRAGLFDPTGRMARINLGEIRAAQQPLVNLAAETGGEAWLNSNSLESGITKAINETSNYYRLAWRPANLSQTKPEFVRLKINIKDRPDLVVRVPSGFFTDETERSKSDAATSMLSVDDRLMAVIRDSYPRREVPIVISTGYLNTEKDGLVLAASVQLEQPEMTAGSEMDLIGALIDETGNIVSSLKQTISFNSTTNASSFTTLQFPRLSPGSFQVRIAARDSKSGRIGSAAQWINIPKTIQNELSISSLFLSEGPPSPGGSAQKWIIKPDRTFERSSKLRFQAFLYNADHSTGAPKIELQLELSREGQLLVQTPLSQVSTDGIDLERIPVSGEFPLESLQSGRYELKLILNDLRRKSSAVQQANFTIR